MKACLSLLIFAAAAFPVLAAAPAQPVQEVVTLDNGLKVVLREDRAFPIVVVYIWYKVGSGNEGRGETGRAHLFEHYMFRHNAKDPEGEDFNSQIAALGGESNASTNQYRTDYYSLTPSEALERVFQIEARRMRYVGESVDSESLRSELDAVQNEKDERLQQPFAKALFEHMYALVWGPEHPYQHNIIGLDEDISSMTAEDARKFFYRYYRPANAVMAVVGDFDRKEAKDLLGKWFGPIPGGAAPAPLKIDYRRLGGRREATVGDPNVVKKRVFMAYPIPGHGKPDALELDVLAGLLGGGRTSRLVEELQIKRRLVTGIGASVHGFPETDLFVISATPVDGVSQADLEAAINAEIRKVTQKGITRDEMRRYAAVAQTSMLDSLQNAHAMASQLAEGLARDDDASSFERELENLAKMSPERPRAMAAKYLGSDNSAVLWVVPGGKP